MNEYANPGLAGGAEEFDAVARRVELTEGLERWGWRLGAFTAGSLALLPYALFDILIGAPVIVVVALLLCGLGLAALLLLVLVVIGEAAYAMVALRLRPVEVQEAELAAAFATGAPKIRLRTGDYHLGREHIEQIAARYGYRTAGKRRRYRTTVVFRSNTAPIEAEENEIVALFDGTERLVKVRPQEFRVTEEKIGEIARRAGYELKERVSLRSGVRLAFHRPSTRRAGKWIHPPQGPGEALLYVLLGPFLVCLIVLLAAFRAWRWIVPGVVVAVVLNETVAGPAGSRGINVAGLVYLAAAVVRGGYLLYHDFEAADRPVEVQEAELHTKFRRARAVVAIDPVRFSVSEERMREIAEQHGYSLGYHTRAGKVAFELGGGGLAERLEEEW